MDVIVQSHLSQTRVKGIYPCSVCGKKGVGDTMLYESEDFVARPLWEVFNLAGIMEIHAMPVGWAHYGNGVYKCPNCAT